MWINTDAIACEWRRILIKKFGDSYWFYLKTDVLRCGTMCYDVLRCLFANQYELNTNWYDAVRYNTIQHDVNTVQCEPVRWWWRTRTIALRDDKNYYVYLFYSDCNFFFFYFSSREHRAEENYYFFTFSFSRPEVGKLFHIYFFTFSRPEVGKWFHIYFYFFSTWTWKIIPYLLFLELKLESYYLFTFSQTKSLLFLLGNFYAPFHNHPHQNTLKRVS